MRPEVDCPELLGAVGQRNLHQSERVIEVPVQALHEDVRHAGGLAELDAVCTLDNFVCLFQTEQVIDLEVIDDPAAAMAALDPVRSEILAHLVEPGSATSVANTLGLARQKVNYHLRLLEDHRLVTLVEMRPRRGLTERVLQASAQAYVISPSALGAAAPNFGATDRLSNRYLIALGARMVREVADLARHAEAAKRPLATLAIDSDIRFASATERAAFTEELAGAVVALTAKYHHQHAPGGRWHRIVIAAHPRPST